MFKNIKLLLMGAVVLSFMVGCGGSEPSTPTKSEVKTTTNTETIYVSSKATYSKAVAKKIQSECSIDSQIVLWIKKYAKKENINIVIDGKPKAGDKVLRIYIMNAVSKRHAGVGYDKYVSIYGRLYGQNKEKLSFKAARRSGGGYFGAYKSSCNVLGSCAKTIGRDVAGWLANPVDNSKLGDTYLIR